MPGFTTHYVFGIRAFFQCEEGILKEAIKENRDLYRLGLQGPDMFFCHPRASIGVQERNIGSNMHELLVNEYFRQCFYYMEQLPKAKISLAASYIAGFLTHYVLDSMLHPYIYSRVGYVPNRKKGSKQISGAHANLETMIDWWILKYYKGEEAKRFRKSFTLFLSEYHTHFVCNFLANTINETYYKDHYQITVPSKEKREKKGSQRLFTFKNENPYKINETFVKNTLHLFRMQCNALHDKTGRKKKYLELVENHTLKYPLISAMIYPNIEPNKRNIFNLEHHEWKNPWDKTIVSNQSLTELFALAKNRCESIFQVFDLYLDALINETDYVAKRELLLSCIGNDSYHSGLDCSI